MDLSELRQSAIRLLDQSSQDVDEFHRQSPQELIHELRVQQIELEMQNDELRRAQFELEESRDRFANLFDFAPVGYVTIDADNRIVEANLTIAKLLGVDRGALVGRVLSQYIIPEDATRLTHHLRDANSADEKSSCELTLKSAVGNLVRARLDSIAASRESRSIAITDLSNNAALLREKQESDDRLRVICHALPIPITYIDREETYKFNNAAHEQWFKISRESILGRHVKEVLGDEIYDVVESRIKRVLAGRAGSCRLELTGGEAGPRAVEVRYAPHHDDAGRVLGFYELMMDVTASVHLEGAETRHVELEVQLVALSTRQRAIFDLLMAGKSNKAISHELDRSMRTIERERHNILQLLGVGSMAEMLVKFAGHTASTGTNLPLQ